jgi:hypothetical protein
VARGPYKKVLYHWQEPGARLRNGRRQACRNWGLKLACRHTVFRPIRAGAACPEHAYCEECRG